LTVVVATLLIAALAIFLYAVGVFLSCTSGNLEDCVQNVKKISSPAEEIGSGIKRVNGAGGGLADALPMLSEAAERIGIAKSAPYVEPSSVASWARPGRPLYRSCSFCSRFYGIWMEIAAISVIWMRDDDFANGTQSTRRAPRRANPSDTRGLVRTCRPGVVGGRPGARTMRQPEGRSTGRRATTTALRPAMLDPQGQRCAGGVMGLALCP
jgi:hypothetical protein